MTRGSAVLVPPGSRGADAAFPPAAAVWTGDGIVWMGRYVSTPDGNPKNLTEGEIDAVAAADGGLAYFVEQAEGTPTNSTLEDDRTLARQAAKLAKRWGLPKQCPFWYAVDTSPFGHMPQLIDSFGVYRDESDGWPVGAYIGSQGGEQLMDLGLIDYFHIPSAASWSETSAPQNGTTVVFGYRDNGGRVHNMYISPLASVRQHASIPYFGTRIDPNDTLLATPMWFPGREPVDPPEDDMAKFTLFPCTDDPAVFGGMFDGAQFHTVEWMDADNAAHFRQDGVPEFPVSRYGFTRATLLGPLPPGWSAVQFRRVVDATPGKDGAPGKDAPIPKSLIPVYG